MDYREATTLGGHPLRFRSIVTPNTAFSVNYVTQTLRQSPPAAIATIRAAAFRRYPESLLLKAWNRPESLRWLADTQYDGRKHRVASFADLDGEQIALYFDAQTNLLTKSEVLTDDPVLGDVTIEVIYSDWRPVNKIVLPFRYTEKVGGSVLSDLRASSIVLDTQPDDSIFALPEGFAKIEPVAPGPIVKKLADNIYALLGSYNSMFVIFNDFVLVIEAGANSRYTQRAIAEIKKIAPEKPIRYLVSTHFHFDHVGGVRSYIAQGTTIITTLSAKRVIEKAATATHALRPDALSRTPRPVVVEILNGKRVLDDGTHAVEFYEFTSPHVGQMIIAYFPKEKILFEGDLLDLDIPEGGAAPAGEDTADLLNRIQKLGLQVERIVPVHGRIGSMNDLRQAVEKQAIAK
jgi:glyoxylase-like metal-dependent hydrolase (beta-lactamase superfamily II)